jgi:hypothetical protein
MNRDFPIAPIRRVGALSLDKIPQAFRRFSFSDFGYVLLFLCKAISATVTAPFVGVKANR